MDFRFEAQHAAQLQAAIAEKTRRTTSNSFRSFIPLAWRVMEPRRPFIPGWHIDAIADHLEALYRGQIRNLLINIPPRNAKSSLVSVAFPAWVWTEEARHRFIYGSHSFSLAKRDSIKTRNLITSAWYRETFNINWELAADQNEKANFLNTDGGFRRATSVEGQIIGEGGDTLVLDDPHSPRSVRSDVQRADELRWVDEEFFTRENDPKTTSKIVIMQRLDQRDCSAHLLAKGDWEHLMLPAEFEPERRCRTCINFVDPRTYKGEPLWKQRYDVPEIEKTKKSMGTKAWAGQGQQRPAPAEGNIFKRANLQKFYKDDPIELGKTMEFLGLSVDLPFDEGGTYAVFQVWGKKGPDRYLLDQTRDQVGFNEQKTMFKAMCHKWPNLNAKWVEKKANGAAIISTMKLEFHSLLDINPQGSKEVRAEAVEPQFASGNVYLPDPSICSWINDYIEELVIFNNGLWNDQVDATTQALMMMNGRQELDVEPQSFVSPSKWRNVV